MTGVAEVISAVALGVKAVKFLGHLEPTKVLDRASHYQEETEKLSSEPIFQKNLGQGEREELRCSQIRIDRAKQGLPESLTLKEIAKRPKLIHKAYKYHDRCKELRDRVRTISSTVEMRELEATQAARQATHANPMPTTNSSAVPVRLRFQKESKAQGYSRDLELSVDLPNSDRNQPFAVTMQVIGEMEEDSDAIPADTNITLDVGGLGGPEVNVHLRYDSRNNR